MRRMTAAVCLSLIVLTGCESYSALFLRDGPWDIHNADLMRGNVTVDNPDDMGFTYPVQIHWPFFGRSNKDGLVGWDLDDEPRIYWTAVTGADQYQIRARLVTIRDLIDEEFSHYPEAEFDVSGDYFGPLTLEENNVNVDDLNVLVFGSSGGAARNRLQNTFSPDRSVGSDGIFLTIRARVNGIWSDWTWEREPFIEVFYQEAGPW